MNLFLLHWNPRLCARMHFDRHVVKMILELAQILSTAHHVLQKEQASVWMKEDERMGLQPGEPRRIYRSTHVNHPVVQWARRHVNNYRYTACLGLELCTEYTFRYGKVHKTEATLHFLSQNVPPADHFENPDAPVEFGAGDYWVTCPAQAMPEALRCPGQPIDAYRAYYQSEVKAKLRAWKNRERPDWFAMIVFAKAEPVAIDTQNPKKRRLAIPKSEESLSQFPKPKKRQIAIDK